MEQGFQEGDAADVADGLFGLFHTAEIDEGATASFVGRHVSGEIVIRLAGFVQVLLGEAGGGGHVLEMFRRAPPNGSSRACFDRLSNRLTKILSEACKLRTP
jgi:hypothetical protein